VVFARLSTVDLDASERQEYVKGFIAHPSVARLAVLAFVAAIPLHGAARAQYRPAADGAQPTVFQAAGPSIASIQSSLDQFRAALGGANNGNAAGPLAEGRREINWDGGGSTASAPAPTPFTGFQTTRGALFTTPGTGFVQAPLTGLPSTFGNLTYESIFQAFSPVRLFSPVSSNITDVTFFIPGATATATTRGFGAIFSDVDQQGAGGLAAPYSRGAAYDQNASTVMEFYGADNRLLFRSAAPASPGDASLSFVGVMFSDARIARVRIIAGSMAPGPFDDVADIVMMDDFVYGEPQAASVAVSAAGRR
jgi:hypothetical protein